MKHLTTKTTQRNEQGLVSIIVVTIVIIILSLMTAGFAKVMDRELRQSLDRELAVQANYAAESGMNDARRYIAAAATNPAINLDTAGNCLDTKSLTSAQTPYFVASGNVSADTQESIKYTCVNIDPRPKELVFNNIPAGQSKVFKVITPTTLDRLYFGWNNSSQNKASATPLNGNSANPQFPTEGAFNAIGGAGIPATGVLRVSIYPVSNAYTTPADHNSNLENFARTYFLYPNNSPGLGTPDLSDYLAGNQIVNGNCRQSNFDIQQLPLQSGVKRFCNSGIVGGAILAPFFQTAFFYVKITPLYHDLDVSIQATGNGVNNSLSFLKTQAVVDVTAKGNDVLKRLQVRTSLEPDYDYPQFAVQSMDTLCKHLRLPQTGPSSFGSAGYQDPAVGDAYVDLACSGGGVSGSNIPSF